MSVNSTAYGTSQAYPNRSSPEMWTYTPLRHSDHITLDTKHHTTTKHHYQIPPQYITQCTTGHHGQLNTHYHLPIITTIYIRHNYRHDNKMGGLSPTTKKLSGKQFTEDTNSVSTITTNVVHTANIRVTNFILMSENHNLPEDKI